MEGLTRGMKIYNMAINKSVKRPVKKLSPPQEQIKSDELVRRWLKRYHNHFKTISTSTSKKAKLHDDVEFPGVNVEKNGKGMYRANASLEDDAFVMQQKDVFVAGDFVTENKKGKKLAVDCFVIEDKEMSGGAYLMEVNEVCEGKRLSGGDFLMVESEVHEVKEESPEKEVSCGAFLMEGVAVSTGKEVSSGGIVSVRNEEKEVPGVGFVIGGLEASEVNEVSDGGFVTEVSEEKEVCGGGVEGVEEVSDVKEVFRGGFVMEGMEVPSEKKVPDRGFVSESNEVFTETDVAGGIRNECVVSAPFQPQESEDGIC